MPAEINAKQIKKTAKAPLGTKIKEDLGMNEAKRQEYLKKYARTGDVTIIPKEKNPYPQMKYESFFMDVAPDFGGFGGSVLWSYVYEPVNMQPVPVKSEQSRYITVFGGDAVDYSKFSGEAEVTLGKSPDDLRVFKLSEAFSVYIEKNMFYAINITKINDPQVPMHYNELIVGENAPPEENPAADDGAGLEKYIKSGAVLNVNYPDKENIGQVMASTHHMFGGKERIRRTWMPVIKSHIMAKYSHTHSFSEYLIVLGSDPKNISDLGGVVEFTIGENEDELETFRVEKATQFYLKKGVWHSPLVFKEVRDPKKPIILCEVSYAAELVHDKELANSIEENDWRELP